MNKITFRFYRSNTIISKMVRKITFGKFSHVAIELEGLVYQALPFKGVFVQQVEQEPDYAAQVTLPISNTLFNYVQCECVDQLNCGYDYAAIFRFLFWFLGYKKNNRWYCSELANFIFCKLTALHEGDRLISPTELYDKVAAFKEGLQMGGVKNYYIQNQ